MLRTFEIPRAVLAILHIIVQLVQKPLSLRELKPCWSEDLPHNLDTWTAADWLDLAKDLLRWNPPLEQILGRFMLGELSQTTLEQIALTKRSGASLIVLSDPHYPETLRFIPDPPLALFAKGELKLFQKPCVTVIGSRKASQKSIREAYDLGIRLAQAGYLVISGGAYGCDIAVHAGALDSTLFPSPTVVVFAGGLDRRGPRGNEWVFRQLETRGALFLSERLWGVDPRPYDFPVRNRIVSGLSWTTIVVQAGLRSGALVTAQLALEHGREVVVLDHDKNDIRAQGSQQLIFDGAPSCNNAAELVSFVQGHFPSRSQTI